MRKVEPKVFLVGETRVCNGLEEYFDHIGVGFNWLDSRFNAESNLSDIEILTEVYGRLCYRSFEPGLNPNVTKVRANTKDYFNNLINVKHGSVMEHAVVNFIFCDVSRVFTHELVRHRAGTAISQESLRYVRLDDLGQWLPLCIKEDEHAMEIFANTFEHLESLQVDLAKHFKLDDPDVPFSKKKEITSAMRRIAPEGLATSIGWSSNIRALRWIIQLRTAPEAEEEIRLVFGRVAEMCISSYPLLFSDFEATEVKGLPHYKPRAEKI